LTQAFSAIGYGCLEKVSHHWLQYLVLQGRY
jgi:hypothetical protein